MNNRQLPARVGALVLAAILGAVLHAAVGRQTQSAPPMLSDNDIGFAQDMTAHHQQAVTMTDMLSADSLPAINALAEQIRFTQLAEIGQMSGWLQLVGAPPAAAQPMAWMRSGHGHQHDHGTDMPGMASSEELTRLQRSVGSENQIMFLELMIRHHQGGVTMAGHAARTSANDTVRRAASLMVTEQTEDIQVMTILLNDLPHGR